MMPAFLDALSVRIALIFLASLVVLQVVIALIVAWPDDRPTIFTLAPVRDAARMARAIEAAPPELRPLIVEAFNGTAMTARLLDDFPGEDGSPQESRSAPRLQQRFAAFAADLDGRPFRVQIQNGSLRQSLAAGRAGTPGPVRLFVRLRTQQVLEVARAPVILQRFLDRMALVAAAVAVVLLAVLFVCVRQIARPTRALSTAARHFAADMGAPDLPLRGPRELKELAAAFNEMKGTIRGLVDGRTRMLAAIAHDMRTYLTRLRLRADFIADEDQRGRAVSDIEEMGKVLEDTLTFAREATVRERADCRTIDVGAELAAFAGLRREMGEAVEDMGPAGEPLLCRCAPLALRRMLANLTENALRYGATARLRAWKEDDAISIAVEDDGPGVPADALDKVTAPFERLEPSRGRQTGGAGLGLAIVKALAQSQGGSLSISNRPEGGLRAQIRLPGAPAPGTATNA